MGEGGYILLVNGTPYSWKRGKSSSYQMATWKFPSEIKPGTVASVYVEFKQSITTTRSDTSASCSFALKGSQSRALLIQANDAPSNLKVQLQNIQTPNNASGSWLQLGWQHDGIVSFVLSGKEGKFSSSNPPRDWMQQNLATLGTRPLHKICLPGSHDAGMGEIHVDLIPKDIMADFTQTQSLTIRGQLDMGSRYFDIRPTYYKGEHWTGHFTGKLGARGQKISSIIDDINNFTQQCSELIIINISHSLQIDKNYVAYEQADWNSLFAELTKVNHRYILTGPEANDLSLLPLNRFIGSGAAAVVLVVEAANIQIGAYSDQGFYLTTQLNVYNEYSDTNDCVRMAQDQIKKMQSYMSAGDKRLFLLSWTLTQQDPGVKPEDFLPANLAATLKKLANWSVANKTIRILAYSANKALLTDLLPATGPTAFPNIVYIDYLEKRDYVALTMAINNKVFTN